MKSDTIWKAARRGDLDAVRRFATRDGVPDVEDDYDVQSLLTVACEAGHIEVVRFLLEHRQVHRVDYAPEAFAAMRFGRYDVLQLLLEWGTDPNAAEHSKHGPSLFQVAFEERNVPVVRLLLLHGDYLGTVGEEYLDAEITENENEVEFNEELPPMIELAARAGDEELTQFLVEVGAPLDGETPEFYVERARQNEWKFPKSLTAEPPQEPLATRNHGRENTEVFASDAYQTFWGCVLMVLLTLLGVGILRFVSHLVLSLGWFELVLWLGVPLCIYVIGKFGRNAPPE